MLCDVRQIHNSHHEHEFRMHIEFRHLRTIKAIHEAGGLAKAAEQLHITQSALSHQIKGLEDQAGVELFVRRSKPMKLSAAGLRLLRLAEQILPQVQAMQDEFSGLRDGRSGRMHIAIECHACFEWLFPVLERFRKDWPDVDVDIRPGLAFEALPALLKEEVDLVVSSDPEELAGVEFIELFDYAPVFVASKDHPLAAKSYIEAEDFRDQTLITYPVERSRLDVFSQLLMVREVKYSSDYVTRPLTAHGLTRRLYAAVRSDERGKPYMERLIELARTEARKLQRA